MSRSGLTDDGEDQWALIRWRGAVKQAINGKRGQAFLKEMLAALDALPEKALIANKLQDTKYNVCAIGAVGKARGLDMEHIDPEDPKLVASFFGISEALAAEIEFMNDEWVYMEPPSQRFDRMRKWIEDKIK